MSAQLSVGEGHKGLARAVFFILYNQLRRSYERGVGDPLGALSLGLNAPFTGTACPSTPR